MRAPRTDVNALTMHPPDLRLERTAAAPARRPCCSTTRRCATGCSRRRCACPTIDEKLGILHLIDALRIDTADIGLPGAGPHVVERRRAPGARDRRISACSVQANCAARTLIADIKPIAEISQRTGHADRVRARSSGRARFGSTPRAGRSISCCKLTEEAITLRGGRGPAGDVRHRRHDARRSRHAARLYSTRDPRRRAPRLHRRHRRPRDAARARAAVVRFVAQVRRRMRRRRRHRLARPPRPRPRDHEHAGGARGRRDAAARRRASASASASATRRWTCCSSTWC